MRRKKNREELNILGEENKLKTVYIVLGEKNKLETDILLWEIKIS